MKFLTKRQSLSPPKPPGIHTNRQVKEALHTRAVYRSVIVVLIVLLLLIALAAITNTTQEIEDTSVRAPKMLILSLDHLAPARMEACMRDRLMPFTQLLQQVGGVYGRLRANYPAPGSRLVKWLTGSPSSTRESLEGAESFLRVLKNANFRTVLVAAAADWSSNQMADPNVCTRVGVFDSECTGRVCPGLDHVAYCSATRKYRLCEGRGQLSRFEAVRAWRAGLRTAADVTFVQLSRFADPGAGARATAQDTLELCSDLSLLDGALGMLVLSISQRTRSIPENWLIVLTGDGANSDAEAPLLMVAYSEGRLIQLKAIPSGLYQTTDLYHTILTWFGRNRTSDLSNLIGICTTGVKASNCKE